MKKIYIAIAVIAAIVIAILILKRSPVADLEPTDTGSIEQELQGINLDDLDKEFQDIDTELQGL